ncbi:LysR family transcriptional regulator [Burkholderia gladioli]|uniref:LysR family transcriptional regulator n=1 Tax=Burkholderia gladioli TaxID=28095 RepID=UPI00163EC33E|nr:LysR family transcriptional regulator [Burkholderia gladioli]
MARDNFSDLLAFLAVARERSFTKAASQLGVSQSALSHTIRGLETRLGVRLLTRTTRSVATTEAGERLMQVAGPRFDEIESELNALSELRDKPVGLIRITATDHPVETILWPRLKPLLADYPGLKIEMSIDYNLSDIVAQRYDIGVRFGDQVANDMIAVRIGPDVRMMIAGSPEYFARHPAPKSPQDLLEHACINLRLPTRGSLYAWELRKGKHDLLVRVDGQLIFNSTPQMLAAALEGFGLVYLPEDQLMPQVRAGRLKCVLKEWGATFPGYHAYYPSRRQSSRALSLVIDALRHRD